MQHLLRIIVSILCFLFVFTIHSFSQSINNNYAVSFLTTQDGLSQGTNRYMLQDSKGYMWLSSQDGINRYNGNVFFHFNHPRYFQNCKPFKQVFGIVEDVNGNIWLGSRDGLFMYNQGSNLFIKPVTFSQKQDIESIVMPFAAVGNEIWFSENTLSFKAIDCNTKKIRVLSKVKDSLELIEAFRIIPQVVSNGTIWMANARQLYKINVQDQSIIKYPVFLPGLNDRQPFIFRGISLDTSTHILAIATVDGLILFDTEKGKQIHINDRQQLIYGEETWYVKAAKGFFWVSNDKCHLIKVSADGKRVIQMFDKKVLDNIIHRGSGTACIYIDKWDRLWLNADGEYIAIIDLSPTFIKKVVKGIVNGLPSGTMLGITSVGNEVWVSDTYLSVIDKQSARIKKTISAYDLTGKQGFIRQVFYDSIVHRIWFTTGAELYYYSLLTGKTTKPILQVAGNSNIDYVRNFVRLNNDELLMVRLDGVYKINNAGSKGNFIEAFGNKGINHLCRISGNRLALAVIGQPLKIFAYSPEFKLEMMQSIDIENTILMVSEDEANGVIWAATEQGVYKIDNSTYKIIYHYTLNDGMANDFVYAAIPDKFGWVWCSTNKGIVAINQATDAIRNFGLTQNLQDQEFNNRAFSIDSEGFIYFGGVKGLNYFKPPFIDKDTVLPSLVIEDITLDNLPYSDSINPDKIQTIHYKYAAVPLSIKVHALQLKKAAGLKIQYRLAGKHQNWIEISNGENIQMFNLAAGKYDLEITYTDGIRGKTYPIRVLPIEVMPPWYNAWWFLLLAALITIAAIWFIAVARQRQQLRKLQQENEIIRLKADQQSIVVKERERITADLHDDVGATLSSMNIYGDLASAVWDIKPAQSREMVGKISIQSKELMNRMSDIVWSLKPPGEEKNSFTGRLKNYTQDLLAGKGIAPDFDIDEPLAAKMVNPLARKNILLIAKEAINNIAKYSEATGAGIKFNRQLEEVVLTISDNGKGFDKIQSGQGNGLGNIEQRCRQLSGSCTIDTERGSGVTITCRFPIAIISHTG